ncbi:MAG: AmmeMemoRadiSam system protein A [Sulfurimonas sp.]|nr:AmmeMemoRadiSam system protein A [Sulfurimonas sp.]
MLDAILLSIAKSAILSRFDNGYFFDREKLLKKYAFLNIDGATFVTLKYNGELRGCIGSLVAYRILYEDIFTNAISASFSDPRFKPLDMKELENLTLEVSLLSEPILLKYEDFEDLCQKIKPNIDGLILKHHGYSATFLPQVWEQLSTPKLFLQHLSMKAGVDMSIFAQHPIIYRYHVDSVEDKFNAILSL